MMVRRRFVAVALGILATAFSFALAPAFRLQSQTDEFRDNIFAYRKAGAVIPGISVDDLASHKKFAEEHSLPFPILADLRALQAGGR